MHPIEFLLSPLLKPNAYLDPGSGSILLQLVIGGLLGLGFLIKAFWGRIKGFFHRSDSTEENPPQDD
jgi:hypothetical protein